MSRNIKQIPFTEIVERTIEISRLREDVTGKVRGIVNDVYVRDIPRVDDWMFFIARTSLTLSPEYNTGNATVTTGGTSVSFSGATLDSSMSGRKIKFSNADYIYDFTYSSPSDGTISPALVGSVNISGGAFSIYQNIYDLPRDFDRFPKNGGLHMYQGGKPKNISEKNYDYYIDHFNSTPNDNLEFCRVTGFDQDQRQVEVIPPPRTQGSVECDYLKSVTPLKEYTDGTITISASGNIAGGTSTTFTNMSDGDYLRADGIGTSGDSEWYRIKTIVNTTTLVIDSVWGSSSITTGKFTISSAPQMPEAKHLAVLYGAVTAVAADQNDPVAPAYKQKYADIMSDNKKIYRTRLIKQDVPTIAEEYHYRR